MLAGLLTIGLGGCLVDFVLIVWTSSEGRHFTGFLLIMHLTYPDLRNFSVRQAEFPKDLSNGPKELRFNIYGLDLG